MAKILFVAFVLFGFNLWASAPSSEIPERREFPVNPEVNPCEDFYQYTCSKAIEGFKLRDDRSRHIFAFSDSAERLLESKKTYLKNLPSQEKKTSGEQELSDVFSACMNTKARAEQEKAYVQKVLRRVESWTTREEMLKAIGAAVGKSEYSFLDFGTLGNQKKPMWNDVYILGDLRGLPERSYYKDAKTSRAYRGVLADFFKTLNLKNPYIRAKNMYNLEKAFDAKYPTPKEWRSIWTKPSQISKEELKTKYKEFYLDEFLSKVPKKTLIRNFSPDTYDFLISALRTESLQTLKSIYLFQALSGKMDEAYPEYYKKRFEFKRKHLGGPKVRPELSERCTRVVMKKFMKELDYELYPKLFGDFSKSKFLKLAKRVRKSLLQSIKDNDWLSPQGKKAAAKKMKHAFLQVVKPNNKKEWDFNYKADYSATDHLANMDLWEDKINEKELDSLRKKQSNKVWSWGPLIVNAYYSPINNKFVMPVGILQYPFYDQDMPDYVNLGAVGVVVGHELGHGIDDSGSKFDHKGRLNQWMTKADLKEFKRRGQRLVSQFARAGHNGKLTLGENIGDLVGVTTAYNAAFPNGEGSKEHKRAFFTQYGRAWCGVMRPGERKRLLKIGPHSLVDARVNEQVKHQKGFADAFNCKPGDKMYLSSQERVRIW